MSEENTEKPKNKIVFVTLVYDNEVYGGQIQVWKKTPKE